MLWCFKGQKIGSQDAGNLYPHRKKVWLGLENFIPNVDTDTLLGNLLDALDCHQELVSRYKYS